MRSQSGVHVNAEYGVRAIQLRLQPGDEQTRSGLQLGAAVEQPARITVLTVRDRLAHGTYAVPQPGDAQAQRKCVASRR